MAVSELRLRGLGDWQCMVPGRGETSTLLGGDEAGPKRSQGTKPTDYLVLLDSQGGSN